jgi:hypothetical protein
MEGDMAYITTNVEVEVYLEEFDDDDLIDEIESRGYEVFTKNASRANAGESAEFPNKSVEELYTTYTTCSPEFFDRELKKFFSEHLNVVP